MVSWGYHSGQFCPIQLLLLVIVLLLILLLLLRLLLCIDFLKHHQLMARYLVMVMRS